MATRPPYTQGLWFGVAPSTGTQAGPLVPAGQMWVVRNVNLFTPGLVIQSVGGWVLSSTNLGNLVAFDAATVKGNSAYSWEGREAVAGPDQLVARVAQAGFTWAVTGFVFPL